MGTPRLLTPLDQIRNVQRTASCGETRAQDCARETERCRSNEKQSGAIALSVTAQVAFSSGAKSFFAIGSEIGALFFFDVAQQLLLAQQPGLHALWTGESERMQVRAETCNGAVVSATASPTAIAILLNITKLITHLPTAVDPSDLSEIPICDNISAMKLPARLLLAVFAISLASLTPVLPDESFPPVQPKACCADMNMDAGARCPFNPDGTSSSSFACCSGPAICLLLYFGNTNAFAAGAEMSGIVPVNDDRVTGRSRRPPVPPPRTEFS